MGKRLKYKYHRDGEIPLPGTRSIFVFGSNDRGAHGKGAALIAKDLYGAEYGVGSGLMGRCYGIPTKDRFMRTKSLYEIKRDVDFFVKFTHSRPDLDFWITSVGCGLAGYKGWQVGVFFKGCNTNCNFPKNWRPYVE